LKFGQLQNISVKLNHVGSAFVLGVAGGLLGSLFITVSTYLSFFRKKYITNDMRRIMETTVFGVFTISIMTLCVIFAGHCEEILE
jgi:H+/Cl- antiporter ClcA